MNQAQNVPLWYGVAAGLIGLLLIFAGYRTLRVTARFASAIIFLAVGLGIGTHIKNPYVAFGVAVALGVVGYLLGNVLYFVNVAINGAGAGIMLVGAICLGAGVDPGIKLLIAGAVLGGGLALFLERPIGILATSTLGSGLFLIGVLSFFHGQAPRGVVLGALAAFFGLIVAGCVVQAKTTRNLPAKGAPATSRAA